MSEDLRHECGVAALYWLQEAPAGAGRHGPKGKSMDVASMLPGMLLDLQNRGQLASGISTYDASRAQLLDTFKDVGTVAEVFRTSHPGKYQAILDEYTGCAGIGHTRYATSGAEDARYAQPFERHHARPHKWFSFAFNGQLANFAEMKRQLQHERGYHFSLGTDTEVIMHALAHGLRGERISSLKRVMAEAAEIFDGAYNIAFLDALGRMFVARDPIGIRPMHWAVQGRLFGAASESVALTNAGFEDVRTLEPGQMAIIEEGRLNIVRYAPVLAKARCFFEWVYFSNVASQIDGMGVYQSRAATGERLAAREDQTIDSDCVVVPVPDTAKAAADSFAYHLGVPCMEGLIRNRYVGRSFIQPEAMRQQSAQSKYTPLPSVLQGRRVFLVEDSIVRSLTLKTLVSQIKEHGGAKEVHVRVACPPIIAPCFYGIDMSTVGELFASAFSKGQRGGRIKPEAFAAMAKALSVDSLRYLDVGDLAKTIGCGSDTLCLGCVTGKYPTEWGEKLFKKAKRNLSKGVVGRTYG